MSDPETLGVYDARAAEYAAKFVKDKPGPLLRRFMAALPAGGHVLDLGCGPGGSAVQLLANGFTAVGMDASSEMVAHARAAGVEAIQATYDDLKDVAAFDGVWCNFALLHAPRDAMPDHLAAIHRALKPGGHFHVALKTGTGSARDKIGRLYTFYSEQELSDLMTAAGFSILDTSHGEDAGLAGDVEPWIALLARG